MDTAVTSNFVSSHDVNGTRVYSSIDGAHVGEIDHLVIDKTSGKVAYADMGFGGFLGMGEEHHLIPWAKLHFSTDKQGFVTDLTREQLDGAPPRGEDWQRDREWERRTFDHFAVPYYWM